VPTAPGEPRSLVRSVSEPFAGPPGLPARPEAPPAPDAPAPPPFPEGVPGPDAERSALAEMCPPASTTTLVALTIRRPSHGVVMPPEETEVPGAPTLRSPEPVTVSVLAFR